MVLGFPGAWFRSLWQNVPHYENTPIQIYRKFHLQKTENFLIKNSDIFQVSAQNIDCGYSLEPPRRGGSNEYPQSMFLSTNMKNNVYPCKPQFYYIKKWGLTGQNYIGTFSWCCVRSSWPVYLKLFRCFCNDLKMCIWLGYNPQINFITFRVLNFILHAQILSKCIGSGYCMSATLYANLFETVQMYLSMSEDVHVIWI